MFFSHLIRRSLKSDIPSSNLLFYEDRMTSDDNPLNILRKVTATKGVTL